MAILITGQFVYPPIIRQLRQNIGKTTYGTKMRDVYVNIIFRRYKPQK